MFSSEEIQALEEVLAARDEESVKLGLEILRQQGDFTTENLVQAQAVLAALRDVVNKDFTPDRADMENVRHIAVGLIFEIGKRCCIDPIEVLFTCVNPGPSFDIIDEDIDI